MVDRKIILRQMWLAQAGYFLAIAMIIYAKIMDFLHLPWWVMAVIVAFNYVAQVVFYRMVHTGFSLRFDDPGLTVLQIGFSVTLHMPIIYFMDYQMRGMMLLVMAFPLLFANANLSYRQSLSLATYCSVLYLVIIATLRLRHPDRVVLAQEVVSAAVFIGFSFWLGVFGGYSHALRTRLRRQNKTLLHANQQLLESQSQVFDTAHRAGMADVAAEVLHEVGNALNHVNISGHVIGDGIKNLKIQPLIKTASLMGDHQQLQHLLKDSEQADRIAKMLNLLSESLAADQTKLSKEVSAFYGQIERVRGIVESQNQRTFAPQSLEVIELDTFIATQFKDQIELIRNSNVAFEFDLKSASFVAVQRYKFQRVILNLLVDTLHSFELLPRQIPRDLQITSHREESDVFLILRRSGLAQSDETIPKLFAQKHVSKSGALEGLHYCGNAIREMSGDIVVQPLEGGGLVFKIRLPTIPRSQKAKGD